MSRKNLRMPDAAPPLRDSMPRSAVWARTVLPTLVALGLAGCGGGEDVAIFSPATDPVQIFHNLTLDHHAINLSTISAPTLQLTATPRNMLGQQMVGLPAVTFRSSDTTAVQVSATGLLTARRGVTGVTVTAEIVAPGNVRRADTAHVNVIEAEAPTLTNFALDPVLPDSAVWSMGTILPASIILEFFVGVTGLGVPVLHPRPLDATNNEIPGLAIEYVSLDSTIATVRRWSGEVTRLRPGSVSMVARTTVYGVTKADTATFTVTFPVGQSVVMFRTLTGSVAAGPGPTRDGGVASEYRIAPHGYIIWFNLVQDAVDVTFEAPSGAVAIPDFVFPPPSTADCADILNDPNGCALNTMQIRQFVVPGIYRFTSTSTGVTGRIVVGDGGATSAAAGGP